MTDESTTESRQYADVGGQIDITVHHVGGKHPDGTPIALGKWTFETPVVREVVLDNLGTQVLNACAGKTTLVQAGSRTIVRNDINEDRDAEYHHDVCTISEQFDPNAFDTVVFDPPFDQAQADEHYESMHARDLGQAREELAGLVCPGGRFIELGWNSHSVAAWHDWERTSLHIFERGPCLQPVFLTVDRKIQTKLTEVIACA